METIKFKCENCGWSGTDTSALFPMHPSEKDGPRCPKCFSLVKKTRPKDD